LYGMEYSQIIHPSCGIKQMKGLKVALSHRINGLFCENMHFKNQPATISPDHGVKSDRLLGSWFTPENLIFLIEDNPDVLRKANMKGGGVGLIKQ